MSWQPKKESFKVTGTAAEGTRGKVRTTKRPLDLATWSLISSALAVMVEQQE